MEFDTGNTIALNLGDRGFHARGVGSECGLSQDVEGSALPPEAAVRLI